MTTFFKPKWLGTLHWKKRFCVRVLFFFFFWQRDIKQSRVSVIRCWTFHQKSVVQNDTPCTPQTQHEDFSSLFLCIKQKKKKETPWSFSTWITSLAFLLRDVSLFVQWSFRRKLHIPTDINKFEPLFLLPFSFENLQKQEKLGAISVWDFLPSDPGVFIVDSLIAYKRLRRGSRILVRGPQWSFEPKGGAWAQNVLKIGVFSLKTAWFWRNIGGKGARALRAPSDWIRYWVWKGLGLSRNVDYTRNTKAAEMWSGQNRNAIKLRIKCDSNCTNRREERSTETGLGSSQKVSNRLFRLKVDGWTRNDNHINWKVCTPEWREGSMNEIQTKKNWNRKNFPEMINTWSFLCCPTLCAWHFNFQKETEFCFNASRAMCEQSHSTETLKRYTQRDSTQNCSLKMYFLPVLRKNTDAKKHHLKPGGFFCFCFFYNFSVFLRFSPKNVWRHLSHFVLFACHTVMGLFWQINNLVPRWQNLQKHKEPWTCPLLQSQPKWVWRNIFIIQGKCSEWCFW